MRTMIIGLLLAVGLYADTDKPKPASAEAVARLIAQLGSREFAAREKAMRSLEEIGEPALELLRKAMASPDVEVRHRSTQLVRQIEQRVETTSVLTPTRLRLVCKDMPLPAAVEELARKAGVPIKLQGDREKLAQRKITLDTGETSFWNALDQLCRKAGLVEEAPPPPPMKPGRIQGSSVIIIGGGGIGGPRATPRDILKPPAPEETKPILLVEGKPSVLPAHLSTSIRIRLLPSTAKVPWKPGSDGDFILWKGSLGVRVQKAIDDQGQQLIPLMPPQVEDNGGTATILINQVRINTAPSADEGKQGPVPVKLKKGDKPAKQLKELSGTLLALVQPAPEALVAVDDVLKAKGKLFKGVKDSSVKVLDVTRKEDGEVRLRLLVESPAAAMGNGSSVPANVQIFVNGEQLGQKKTEALSAANFALLDEAGKACKIVKAVNTGVKAGAAQEVELTYQPEPGQKPAARFIYTGRRTSLIEVPFTLKDVPLP
jgi:hypothetical protein